MGIFDKWVDTKGGSNSSLPATSGNSSTPAGENNGMDGILSSVTRSSNKFIYDATDAFERYAKIDSTKVEACISASRDAFAIYGDIAKHFGDVAVQLKHETEETNRVFMQCQEAIEVASSNATAAVEQAYYEFEKVREECKKEIRIKELENEEGIRRHECYMKSLEYAWNVFIKSFDEFSDKAKRNSEQEDDVLKKILDTNDLEQQKNLSGMFIQLKDKNNEVLRLIAELRMQITITPER